MTGYDSYIIYPNVQLGEAAYIGEFSVIGKPTRPPNSEPRSRSSTVLGNHTYIGSHVLVEQGVHVGESTIIEAYAVLENSVTLGRNCFVVHGARICGLSNVGDDCVVGGFVAERSAIGNRCRVLGQLIHRQGDPTIPWDAHTEPAPILEDNVFVAMGAAVIGDIRISHHVYIVAGAVVTRSVPSYSIVHGVNQLCRISDWRGPLRDSPFWG
jgi:acetyltransferase-like isoleucine patch superfamily enzyme